MHVGPRSSIRSVAVLVFAYYFQSCNFLCGVKSVPFCDFLIAVFGLLCQETTTSVPVILKPEVLCWLTWHAFGSQKSIRGTKVTTSLSQYIPLLARHGYCECVCSLLDSKAKLTRWDLVDWWRYLFYLDNLMSGFKIDGSSGNELHGVE